MAMTVSLPDSLKTFIDDEVASRGYSDSSDYVSDLVRQAQEHEQALKRLKAKLVEGRDAPVAGPADAAYFDTLKGRIQQRARR